MRVIKEVLDIFCVYSGHKVNIQKLSILFSREVEEDLKRRISRSFEFCD